MPNDYPFVTGPATRNDPPAVDDWGLVVRPIISALPPVVVVPALASTSTVTSVAVSAVPVLLLAANVNRLGATFFNDSRLFLYLKLGAGATTASYTVRIGPMGFYEVAYPIYTGDISGVWSAAGATACLVTELTP